MSDLSIVVDASVWVSWDKEQLQKASTIVTTYTPENYIFPTTGDSSDEEAT